MEINEYLITLIRVIKDMESLDFFMGDAKLSQTEFRLLREIIIEGEQGGKVISSELARRLGITRSAISQIVTKMEKRGILKRELSPTDKKIAYIRLSDAAYGVFEEQCARANAVMERVTEILGEEKLRSLIAAYDEFASVLNRVAQGADGTNGKGD